jgi:hypothetical protein
MPALEKSLRTKLENTVKAAREIAEAGARSSLEQIGVGEGDAPKHLSGQEKDLRRRLRIHGRQLGDEPGEKKGTQTIERLVEEVAYEHWHRLLFASFLAENKLLMYPDPDQPVAVTISECDDMAADEGTKNGWELAARYAAKMLPQIFRIDSPVFELELPPERQQQLEKLVANLPKEVYVAIDSLGWVYQFWQANRKDDINKSEVKIGARELPAVTQLFTEDYMVNFLLDNTIGAWYAHKVLEANPSIAKNVESEQQFREIVALQNCNWSYLRLVSGADGVWAPAAGAFDGWPKVASELKCLDPCMGSGHFIVAMFERLVSLRVAEEGLEELDAVTAVIRDNLFGLEIDARCTQIAAFNLAIAAWRRVGYCMLPPINLACSGLAPNSSKDEWLLLADENEKLQGGMDFLYELFEQAPVLGSLVNPRLGGEDLLVASFHELQPLLEKALSQNVKDDIAHERVVAARGLAKAAEILADRFTLVATNVPYLGRGKQNDALMQYCERFHSEAKADLATCFVERCLEFCALKGTMVLVSPQNWLFLTSYKKLRQRLLQNSTWNMVAKLGPAAFRDMNFWAANTGLTIISKSPPTAQVHVVGLDVSHTRNPDEKGPLLLDSQVEIATQDSQFRNADSRIALGAASASALLQELAEGVHGMTTGDLPRMVQCFWESPQLLQGWEWFGSTVEGTCNYGGRSYVVLWQGGNGPISELPGARKDGQAAWRKWGV